MTLADRGIVLQPWQQVMYDKNLQTIPYLPRRSGKSYMSYIIVLEEALKRPDQYACNLLVDPDNFTPSITRFWVQGLAAFANTYYPDVQVTISRSKVFLYASPKQSKKQKILRALRGFKCK